MWRNFDWSKIGNRNNTPLILNHMRAVSVAEIGVRAGDFSKIILSSPHIKRFFAIDCWDLYVSADQNDVGWTRERLRQTYETFKEKFCNDTRVEIIKKLSSDAHNEIPDGSLDFIYLDGSHTYESVIQDLENYWPKMTHNSIVSGHDFINYWFKGIDFRVKDAVEDFIRGRGLFIHITHEPRFKSFYIIKR
jgi:hypothetical protein